MPATKKKIVVGPIRTIKLALLLAITLFLGFFFVGEVKASVNESFESYFLGKLNYQGTWLPLNQMDLYNEWSFIVTNERASEGLKSIKSHPTSTDLVGSSELWWATSTGRGILSFDFLIEEKPVFARVSYCYGVSWCMDLTIGTCCAEVPYYTENWNGVRFEGIDLTENVTNNVWHRISLEYNLDNQWARASYDFGTWSATTSIPDYSYLNRYLFRSGGIELNTIYFDNFTSEGECNSTCLYCDFSECQDYENSCSWNFSDTQCQPLILGIPDIALPIESCEGLSITERILCEIKNFFYGLFVPSPAKITELRATLDLIKTKFPYNYILAMKDFFTYMKDNINESQEISFSILGKAGVVNFDFFNSSTTLAGVSQSFLNIFKTFSKFLIILIFGLWCFSFIKRIFK